LFSNWRTYQIDFGRGDIDYLKRESANIIGSLESIIDSDLNVDFRINTFPIYFQMLGLRSIILSDLKYRHLTNIQQRRRTTEEIRYMWNRSLEYWNRVDQIIWDEHPKKFGDVREVLHSLDRSHAEWWYGYVRDGEFQIVVKVQAISRLNSRTRPPSYWFLRPFDQTTRENYYHRQ
jgi:hypothetical protein